MDERPSVIVLGAGVSGLVTAMQLAERGLRVTVLEAAPFGGGRASSWVDGKGRMVDSGLHVVADHYTNLIEVLHHVGAYDSLRWWDEHIYLRRAKEPIVSRFSQLPPPFHLLGQTFEVPMDLGTRMKLGRAGYDATVISHERLEKLDGISYGEWLRSYGIERGLIREFADALADSCTFLTADEASARVVLSWIKLTTRNKSAGRIATWTKPLGEGLVAPLVRAVERAGGTVRFGVAVEGFELEGGRVSAVRVRKSAMRTPGYRRDGSVDVDPAAEPELLRADHVVSALPVQGLRRIMSADQAREAGLEDAFRLDVVPALSIRVWFDRPIAPAPRGTPLIASGMMRDIIDLTDFYGPIFDSPGSVYELLIGRAKHRIEESDEQLVAESVDELRAVWPAVREGKVIDSAVERIESAMFAATPGSHKLRPPPVTGLSNLHLAGDWTRHLLNASMEGATTAALQAASSVLTALGHAPLRIAPPAEEPAVRRLQQMRERWDRWTGAKQNA